MQYLAPLSVTPLLPVAILKDSEDDFKLYEKIINQKKNDKDKIYSRHEPQVKWITKGKDRKPYEYGAKASVVATA